jgi:formylglycine-generating enzyme required for sulfatase activity/serine/threonine protein phosphatase PrpC
VNTETPVYRPDAVAPTLPDLRLKDRWRGPWRGGLRAAYASVTGTSHARNEDCCSHVPSADRPDFCGVADGVGGGAHGEVASSVLLRHCAQAPKSVWSDPVKLVAWLAKADVEVRKAIARRTDQAGAATLAAAWFPTPGLAYVLNVGDCRAYQLRPHGKVYAIERLTVDQTYASLAQEPPPNGKPDDPARMVGAGAVGTPPVVKAQIRSGDLLLFCSDGMHKFVPDAQIAGIVAGGLAERQSLEYICGELVRTAKKNGSQDDASALLVLRRPWFMAPWAYVCALIAVLLLSLLAGAQIAFAETQSVIDPTEQPEAPPAPAAESAAKKPAQNEAGAARAAERRRLAEAERKRARAAARAEQARQEAAAREAREAHEAREAAARAAAKEAAQRDVVVRARQEASVRDAARKAAAARAAATRAAAARATQAKIAAEREAAEREELAQREAARELAVREAAAREAAIKEAAAREAAIKEAAAREAAQKEAAQREAAAREAVARDAARRQAVASVASKLITTRDVRSLRPQPRFGTVFRDCSECPELVWLPQGESPLGESEGGRRAVATVDYTLAVGRFEVTFAEWDACASAGDCRRRPRDSGWGRGRQPVIDISWADARQYTAWLSRKTGHTYRLLTEAEWEYAARAGTDARYWWGNEARAGAANCNDCGTRWDGRRPAPVGSFAANPFGLYDMNGNVWEWVEDCSRDCASDDMRVVRGGAWQGPANAMRSVARSAIPSGYHDNRVGFRVARTD